MPPLSKHINETKTRVMRAFNELLHAIKVHRFTNYASLSRKMDDFINVLMAKSNEEIGHFGEQLKLFDFYNHTTPFKDKMFEFRQFLVELNTLKEERDLLTIRDDILDDVNQFLYKFILEG